jgi:hypothetical protein
MSDENVNSLRLQTYKIESSIDSRRWLVDSHKIQTPADGAYCRFEHICVLLLILVFFNGAGRLRKNEFLPLFTKDGQK